MLTLKDKADIYDLLKSGFKEEERIPLSSLALYLTNQKFSYQEYGYKKLRSLLEDLSFLSIETNEKNPSVVYVVLHSFDKEEGQEKKSERNVLSDKDRKMIAKLLLSEYEPGKEYPLSMVCKYLSDHDVDYKAMGFSRMRKFLESFKDILVLREDKKNKSLVDVFFLNAKKKETKKKNVKEAKLPLPIPQKGCFFVPNNLLLSIKEFTDLGLDNDSLIALLLEDYKKAYLKKNFRQKDDCYIFPLSFLSKEKEPLIASIKKAGRGASYAYYLNFVGSDKEKAKDCLSDYVFFSDYEKALDDLANLAKKEKWCYHNSKDKHIILKIYLQYTFYQILHQNKLVYDEASSFACFNTGLKNAEYEDIYAVLRKNHTPEIKQEYLFEGFTLSAGQGLGKVIIEHFNPLPLKATYIQSANDLVFDASAEIHTDIRHIILDNIDRFPLSFLKTMSLPFAEENKIVNQIEKEKSSFARDKLFMKLEKCLEKNEMMFSLVKVSLEASIAKSRRMVAYDYRNALPSFFPTRNVMSLMLPLEFGNKDEVEAVLLIEKTQSGNYQGQTILTLKQCYVNARLILPLENSFLNPAKIED